MGAIISQEKKKNVLPFLQSNFGKMSEREMARKVGIGRTSISRWCRELGLNLVKHTVNEDFFKEWSEKMSYILGYVFTDGNINWKPEKSYWALTITASEKDMNHLENVRNTLGSTKPLLYSPITKSYRLIVNNKEICKDLMKLGLHPRKSLSIKFPNIPKEFLKDFVRGVVDGDGNVRYVNRDRSPYFEITVSSGSKDFFNVMIKCIESALGVKTNVRRVRKNLFIVQYSCQRGLKLANWIYSNSNIFMQRKFEQYKIALEISKQRQSFI